jgi:hypothetical protein
MATRKADFPGVGGAGSGKNAAILKIIKIFFSVLVDICRYLKKSHIKRF